MPYDPDPVDVDVERIEAKTDKAYLCIIDGGEVWMPKSQIIGFYELAADDEPQTLAVSRWIADTKGVRYRECKTWPTYDPRKQ